MKKNKFFGLLFIAFFASITFCCKAPNDQAWLKDETYELAKGEGFDFSPIGAVVKNKRIIALGESSHGLGKFYELKSALVKYLHQEMDYEVIAMEGGMGDVNLTWSKIDSFSSLEFRDNTLFGNFRAKEVFPLFDYLKKNSNENRPLVYVGFDSQLSSQFFSKELQQILFKYDRTLSDSLEVYFDSYYKWYQTGIQQDSIGYTNHREIIINTTKSASKILDSNKLSIIKDHGLSSFQYEVFQKTLRGLAKSVDLAYNERHRGTEIRDEIMFENLSWLIDTVYPNKKFIIWAHNGHIENAPYNSNSFKWMGHYLKEKYIDDYYALGLFAYKGRAYQHWTQKVIPFENNDSLFVENILMQSEKQMPFINLQDQVQTKSNQWIFQPCNGFELENGGVISFIPKNRFDGLITILESEAPTYSK